jgi:hypothetical protein
MAAAETAFKPSDLAGRWFSKERDLMLDIASCGAAWCGVQVANGTSCGATVLQLGLDSSEASISFIGRLKLDPSTPSLAVLVILYRLPDGGPALRAHGNTGTEVELWRRTFPFSAVFVRAGDTVCPPGAKTS